jgi:hypothetical protein
VNELAQHNNLRQLIEECVGWGDLYETHHTSKSKAERSSEPRKKYYINPALSPFYELPEAHTKEPVYPTIDEIVHLAGDAGAIKKSAPSSSQSHRSATSRDPDQALLPFGTS